MEVKEAIEFLKKFTKMVEDTGFLLKGEEFIWVITKLNGVRVLLEHREAENKELDLEKRGLLLENKTLKEENESYKGMWEELKPNDYEALILEERKLLSTMSKLEQKYLNNGENNGTEKY